MNSNWIDLLGVSSRSRKELKKRSGEPNERGGTGSMKVNVFKCRRNSANVGVQVLAGLGYVILQVENATNKQSNNAVPVYQLLTANVGLQNYSHESFISVIKFKTSFLRIM
jgi:hypothetical protein